VTPQFHPALVNGPCGDPALYIDFLYERRALLFDLGDVSALSPRKLLRLSHICVSHTHVDHFIGFDQVVRIFLGRDKRLHLFGPPGFTSRVGHRLAAYTWNLVENYLTDFTVVATELYPDGAGLTAEFHCGRGFAREQERSEMFPDGILLDGENFRLRTAFLDHKTVSLAFCFEEKVHVNIMKNRLRELGVPTGPWLAELKRQVVRGAPDDLLVRAWWQEGGAAAERSFRLGELRARMLRVVPGQKIVYVTDAAPIPDNASRIVELARGADTLFIEAMFLDADRRLADERSHLTARLAGSLARQADAARVVGFHFSPRYEGGTGSVAEELARAFAGEQG